MSDQEVTRITIPPNTLKAGDVIRVQAEMTAEVCHVCQAPLTPEEADRSRILVGLPDGRMAAVPCCSAGCASRAVLGAKG